MFNSSAVVATSTKFAKSIEKNYRFALGARFPKVFVVPNLVDTDKFFYKYADRVRIRNKYNLNDKTVIAYSGYFSVGRKFKEMINFFLSFKKKIESAHFLCITYEPYKVKEYLSDRLYENLFTVIEARPQEMPALLSAADVALMFLDIDVNYLASPIKFAEYIACGLPVVLNTGISDLDELVEREKIGIIICDFSDQAYSEGIDKLIDIMHDKPLLINRCSTVAKSELSLNNTIKTLEEIYEYVAKA
jgi:glycosyltransferase involved in cell wall biosynthesis